MGYLTGWEGKELPCCPPWLPVAIVSLLCLLQVVLCHAAATRLTTNELQACSRDTVTVKKRQGSGVFEEGAQIKPLFSHLFKSRSFKKKKNHVFQKGTFLDWGQKGKCFSTTSSLSVHASDPHMFLYYTVYVLFINVISLLSYQHYKKQQLTFCFNNLGFKRFHESWFCWHPLRHYNGKINMYECFSGKAFLSCLTWTGLGV